MSCAPLLATTLLLLSARPPPPSHRGAIATTLDWLVNALARPRVERIRGRLSLFGDGVRVAVDGERRVGMPERAGDLRPQHSRVCEPCGVGVAEVVDPNVRQSGRLDRREPHALAEVLLAERSASGRGEHEVGGRLPATGRPTCRQRLPYRKTLHPVGEEADKRRACSHPAAPEVTRDSLEQSVIAERAAAAPAPRLLHAGRANPVRRVRISAVR
jgi:hypothetical protein